MDRLPCSFTIAEVQCWDSIERERLKGLAHPTHVEEGAASRNVREYGALVRILGLCVCVRACVRACARACARACMRECVWPQPLTPEP